MVLEDLGSRASVVGEHACYVRLPSRARHRRKLTLRRDLEVVIVEDVLSGRGFAGVETRWHLGVPVTRELSAAARRRLEELSRRRWGRSTVDRALQLGDRCVLVRAATDPPAKRR